MNPSYFRIRLPLDAAKLRLAEWRGFPELRDLTKTDSVKAVDLACDEQGQWRGAALYFYEHDGWSAFQDLSGGFGFIAADEWLKFAQNDSLVVAGYNDAICEGELIVIEHGKIVRDFVECPDVPEENRNSGRLPQEDDKPISSWIEVASFVDEDPLAFSEEGWLWVNDPAAHPRDDAQVQTQSNSQQTVPDTGTAAPTVTYKRRPSPSRKPWWRFW